MNTDFWKNVLVISWIVACWNIMFQNEVNIIPYLRVYCYHNRQLYGFMVMLAYHHECWRKPGGIPRLYQLPRGRQAILRPHGATTAGGRWLTLLGEERNQLEDSQKTRNQLDHESVKSVGISLFRVLLVRDDILPCYVWIISEIIIRIHIYQPVSNGKYEV